MIDLKPFRAAKDDVKQWCEKLSKWLEDSYWLEKLDQGKLVPKGEKFVNDGDVTINGDLHVLGDTDLDGTLNVDGAATFNAGATINGGLVVNEDSADVDFRVESNGNTAAIFVDAGNDRVGMFTDSPDYDLDIEKTKAAAGTFMRVLNPSTTGWAGYIAQNDNGGTGQLVFRTFGTLVDAPWVGARNYGAVYTEDGMAGLIIGAAAGDTVNFRMAGLAGTDHAVISSTALTVDVSAVFNEAGADQDFRVESDGDANNLFSDGALNRVGIGTNSPNAKLDVRGGAIINEDAADADTRIEGTADVNLLFVDAGANRVGIGTGAPAAKLHVSSDVMILSTAKTPASSTDTGVMGSICWDSGYLYVCTSTNTWVRSSLATW